MKKEKLTILIITVAFLTTVLVSATYAWFASTITTNAQLGVNVTTANKSFTFTSSPGQDPNISFNVTAAMMAQGNVSTTNAVASDSGSINVSLLSSSNTETTTCTYDLVWVWDSSDKYKTPSKTLGSSEKEFSVSGDTGTSLTETDLSKFTWSTKNSKEVATIKSGLSINCSSATTATVKTHTITAKVYNLNVNQTSLLGKTFGAHIAVDNVNCTIAPKA